MASLITALCQKEEVKNSENNCPYITQFGWGASQFSRLDLIKGKLCNLGCSLNEWKFCTNSLFFQTRIFFCGNQSTVEPNSFHSSPINFSKCDGWHIFLGKIFMATSYWMPPSYFSVHNWGDISFFMLHYFTSWLLLFIAWMICRHLPLRKLFCFRKSSRDMLSHF